MKHKCLSGTNFCSTYDTSPTVMTSLIHLKVSQYFIIEVKNNKYNTQLNEITFTNDKIVRTYLKSKKENI